MRFGLYNALSPIVRFSCINKKLVKQGSLQSMGSVSCRHYGHHFPYFYCRRNAMYAVHQPKLASV